MKNLYRASCHMYFLTSMHPAEFNCEKEAEGLVRILGKGVSVKAIGNS